MNDLAICKRIAEIEGETVNVKQLCDGPVLFYGPEFSDRKPKYNPLTDDALCFQLMVKYSVDLTHEFSGLWCACMNPTYTYDECVEEYGVISLDVNPKKAILLSIIEAHKE